MEHDIVTERMLDSKIRLANGEVKLHVQRELNRLSYQLLTVAMLFSVLSVVVALAIVKGAS
jgi:hypothetical protein